MRRYAWLLAPLLLVGCSTPEPEPEPVLTTEQGSVEKPEAFDDLGDEVAAIEKETSTEVGVALFDGSDLIQAGSLEWLPAWSTMKVPIAMTAAEHCEYSEETIEQYTEAAIQWSDNDAARALWDCMGSDEKASELVSAEIEQAGTHITVRAAFGTTRWSFAGQARYGYYLSELDEDNPVFASMHHITEDQRYGLGQLSIPFKGGWSDYEPDGSWHTRQFGWLEIEGVPYGVAIGARSEAGSYDDTMDALDQVAGLLN